MRKITQPCWMKDLPGDSCLNRRDIFNLFGYSAKTSVTQLINAGSIPKPSYMKHGLSINTLQWKISEVRDFIKQIGVKNGI